MALNIAVFVCTLISIVLFLHARMLFKMCHKALDESAVLLEEAKQEFNNASKTLNEARSFHIRARQLIAAHNRKSKDG